jgi:AraC-like DNA-binding protein/mannose-6-phosphate isomerase-like protein (cupin superfamily)
VRHVNPSDHEDVSRPVLAVGNEYPPAFEVAPHRHRRAQLLYAAEGVVSVSTPEGAWVAPPERAVWIPGGTEHAVRMVGAVSTRSVLVTPEACPGRAGWVQVLAVSPLLRRLLITAVDLPEEYDVDGRDGLVMALLAKEIEAAPVVPLAVPFPRSPALAARCNAFVAEPDARATIDQWAAALGYGRRAFTRAFRRETGMSFSAWRQQACLLTALPRLAAGEPVTTVALDLGYDSPAAFTTMFKRLTGISPSRYRPAAMG